MSAGQSTRAQSPDRAPRFVLLVGCPAGFVAACREEACRLGVAVRECDPASAGWSDWLFAVVVTEDAYQERPYELEALARKARVALLRVDALDLCRPGSERALAAAVFESAASLDEDDAAIA